MIVPIGMSLSLSLYDWDGVGPKTWVGFGNFAELFGDPVFYTALKNNLLWLADLSRGAHARPRCSRCS